MRARFCLLLSALWIVSSFAQAQEGTELPGDTAPQEDIAPREDATPPGDTEQQPPEAEAPGDDSASEVAPPADREEVGEAAREERAQPDSETTNEPPQPADTPPVIDEPVDVEASPSDAQTEEESRAEKIRNLPPKLSLPGSPRPLGLGLAPEAPPVSPAPGGRAPSFGTPLGPDDATLVISGNIAAWQTTGIGRRPEDATSEYGGTPLHTPPLVAGRIPFWRQAELSLFITYGTPIVNATVGYFAFAGGREYQGFRQASQGPTFSQAYLTVSPNPFGDFRLRVLMGAFTETYAGPGQWGWGIFGPLIAVRGYGQSSHLEYSGSSKLRFTASAGVMGVPGIPEEFPRGEWTGWTETGVSSVVHHGHAGFNYEGKYSFRLHYASAMGTDERVYLTEAPRDGRMDVFAAEGHWYGVPWGHLGVSGGLWNFDNALSVHDGLWWGTKWTKGASDMIREYIGPAGFGNGKVAAISAEYNTSLARIAWHPRPFDGRAPDVRLSVAGIVHKTLETDDPDFSDSSGYLVGTEIEYQMLRWLSFNVRAYGENRDWLGDRWEAYNIAPGLAFRSDWQSPDRVELWYSRHFYSDVVDNNPAQPLDQHVLALGVFLGF